MSKYLTRKKYKEMPKLLPSTIGSKYMAWSPVLGVHDIRYASELPPFGPVVDQRADDYFDRDIDCDADTDLTV